MPAEFTRGGAQFTFEDDQIILDSVGRGMGYPEIVQKYFPTVNHQRLGERSYHRHNWTAEEDKLILDCKNQGMKWAAIIQHYFPTFKWQRLGVRYAQLMGAKPLPVSRGPSKSNSSNLAASLPHQSLPAFYRSPPPLVPQGALDCTTPRFTSSPSPSHSYQPPYSIQPNHYFNDFHQYLSSTSMQPVFANPAENPSWLSSKPVAVYQSYHDTQYQHCGGPTRPPLGDLPPYRPNTLSPRSSSRRLERLQIPSQSPLLHYRRYLAASHLALTASRTYSENSHQSFAVDPVQYACGYPTPPQQQLVQSRGQLHTPSSKTWPAWHGELIFKDQSVPGSSDNLGLPVQSPNNTQVQHVPTNHQLETINNVQQQWLNHNLIQEHISPPSNALDQLYRPSPVFPTYSKTFESPTAIKRSEAQLANTIAHATLSNPMTAVAVSQVLDPIQPETLTTTLSLQEEVGSGAQMIGGLWSPASSCNSRAPTLAAEQHPSLPLTGDKVRNAGSKDGNNSTVQ